MFTVNGTFAKLQRCAKSESANLQCTSLQNCTSLNLIIQITKIYVTLLKSNKTQIAKVKCKNAKLQKRSIVCGFGAHRSTSEKKNSHICTVKVYVTTIYTLLLHCNIFGNPRLRTLPQITFLRHIVAILRIGFLRISQLSKNSIMNLQGEY